MKIDEFFPTVFLGFLIGVLTTFVGLGVFDAGKSSGKDFCIAPPVLNIFGREIKK